MNMMKEHVDLVSYMYNVTKFHDKKLTTGMNANSIP